MERNEKKEIKLFWQINLSQLQVLGPILVVGTGAQPGPSDMLFF